MNDQTPLPVLGYKEQSEEALRLVNRNKVIEEQLLRHIEAIGDHVFETDQDDEDNYRWVVIAKTHIEQGFMALNRAILKSKRLETLP